jgi:uncharacterized membrane protein
MPFVDYYVAIVWYFSIIAIEGEVIANIRPFRHSAAIITAIFFIILFFIKSLVDYFHTQPSFFWLECAMSVAFFPSKV